MAVKRYLLDTHLVYWWMTDDERLGLATEKLIEHAEIVVSVASVWEMVLKNAKGKLPLPEGSISAALEAQNFVLLPIVSRHLEVVRGMSFMHADPFDRLLIAQAQDEKLTLLSRDAHILALEFDWVEKG